MHVLHHMTPKPLAIILFTRLASKLVLLFARNCFLPLFSSSQKTFWWRLNFRKRQFGIEKEMEREKSKWFIWKVAPSPPHARIQCNFSPLHADGRTDEWKSWIDARCEEAARFLWCVCVCGPSKNCIFARPYLGLGLKKIPHLSPICQGSEAPATLT